MADKEYKSYKFLSNKAVAVKFNYDSGLEKTGDYGLFFVFGVIIEGEQTSIALSEAAAKIVHEFCPLQGKVLIIEKQTYIDEKGKEKSRWIVTEAGQTGASSTAKPEPAKIATPPKTTTPPVAPAPSSNGAALHASMKACIRTVMGECEKNEIAKKFPGTQINSIINTLFMEVSRKNAHDVVPASPVKTTEAGNSIAELMKIHGVGQERLNSHIYLHYKVDSISQLGSGDASKVREWITKQPKGGASDNEALPF